jgi:FtsP/CotA-like multicopper oxidase with cupredoxin domain
VDSAVIRLSRRGLFGLAGGVGVAALVGCGTEGPGTGRLLTSSAPLPEPFRVRLPVPPVATPVRRDGTTDWYQLTQSVADVEVLPGTRTRIWGYDGGYPGPTLRCRSGRTAVVNVRNDLPTPTSTHLHGGLTPSESDGLPTDLIVPPGFDVHGAHGGGGTAGWTLHERARDYTYPLPQRAATLWYHDHRMDFTGPQVWRGLAGAFIVHDDDEEALGLPSGDRDVPLLLSDRAFAADGALRYPSVDPDLSRPGVTDEFMSGVRGDVILVNGAPWPRMEVAAVRYRLRFINGSNSRRYRLRLSAGPLTQIGSDGGLLAAPVEQSAVSLSPGERCDVVVDFSAYRVGDEVTLHNDWGDGRTADVMRFVVTRSEPDPSRLPAVLSTVHLLTRADAVATRQFDFRRDGAQRWTINNEPYGVGASLAAVRADSVELWRFTSDFHHPVHVHLCQFQVLARNGRDPLDSDVGWKDTVDVRPYEVVEVLIRFGGFRGRYVMHCHNLEHEDMAMMANFDVI